MPGLFDNEEMDSIIMEVKQLASDQGVPDNRIAVFQFFIEVSADIDSFSCRWIEACNNSKVYFLPFLIASVLVQAGEGKVLCAMLKYRCFVLKLEKYSAIFTAIVIFQCF